MNYKGLAYVGIFLLLLKFDEAAQFDCKTDLNKDCICWANLPIGSGDPKNLIVCRNIVLTEEPLNISKRIPNLPFIIVFQEVKMAKIPSNFFQNMSIETFALIESSVNVIENLTFAGSENFLEEITIKDSKLLAFPDFSIAKKLQKLTIMRSLSMPSLSVNDTNKIPKSLLEADIKENSIGSIGKEAFLGLDKLSILNLEKNKIKSIGELAFGPKLKNLNLQKNEIEAVFWKSFEKMPNNTKIELVRNKFHEMPKKEFKPLFEKFRVNLEGNTFYCNCQMSWLPKYLNKVKLQQTETGKNIPRLLSGCISKIGEGSKSLDDLEDKDFKDCNTSF